MTFVSLPSITDVFSQSTGASAWAKPVFDEFLPAMWWPIGCFAAAAILIWIGSQIPLMINWMNEHLFGNTVDKVSNLSIKEKRRIFGDMQEIIDEDNLERKINRLGYLTGEFREYRHFRDYKS